MNTSIRFRRIRSRETAPLQKQKMPLKPKASGPERKMALLTGASAGIGFELSRLFAADRIDLVLTARDGERLLGSAAEISKKHGVKVTVIPKDLSRREAAGEIFQELRERRLSIDILVNNAGFNVYGRFAETDLSQELALLQLCAITPTQLIKFFLPHMLEQGYGRILNIGSTGSFVPGPFNSVYCAAKAYLLSFSEALDTELKGSGVTVTAVCPGATTSEFARRAGMTKTRLFRMGHMSTRQVARAAYGALWKEKRLAIPGFWNRAGVFFTRFTPRGLSLAFAKFIMSRRS
jgi:short-subunit dehydrogenase